MNRPASPPGRRPTGDLLALLALVAAVGGLLYWIFGDGDRPLWRSAIGFDGLVTWLRADGLDARSFHGGAPLRPADVGLRILPLYDGDLAARRPAPASQEDLLYQQDAVDLAGAVVEEKLRRLPTLVILPKWRTGVALTGVAHPDLLRDPDGDPVSRGQLSAGGGRVVRPAAGFAAFPVQGGPAGGLRARLYLPQVIEGSSCFPLVGSRQAMVLGRCRHGDDGYWLLADPDLLSNHGLRLGDNAAIGRALVGSLAGGRPVVVDYSTAVWTFAGPSPETAENRRGWADLGRFFAPPFGYLWIGFAVLAAVVLWRASVRFGPVLRRFDDGPRASKAVGIAAKARLLRLTGRDDALLRAHVADRLQTLASELFGPYRRGEPLEQLAALAGPRDPALGRRLQKAALAAETLPAGAATAEAVRRLDHFETAIEQVQHDFGRSTRTR